MSDEDYIQRLRRLTNLQSADYVTRLKHGVQEWNQWRNAHPKIRPNLHAFTHGDVSFAGMNLRKANLRNCILSTVDFTSADLTDADLSDSDISGSAIFRKARLRGASFHRSYMPGADFSEAQLRYSNFGRTDLYGVKFCKAVACGANFAYAHFTEADLRSADFSKIYAHSVVFDRVDLRNARLRGAELERAHIIQSNLEGADLTGCSIYGIAAWDLNLRRTRQADLHIRKDYKAVLTVDNLEVAQFIYLMLRNEKLREVIDTITSKVVLILGRFTPNRKALLEAIREELRKHGYVPVLFDFARPATRAFAETVSALAHIARFIVADFTDAKVVLQELERVVPILPSVPVVPLLLSGSEGAATLDDLTDYPWFLKLQRYTDAADLISRMNETVISEAEAKASKIRARRIERSRRRKSR